MRSAASYSIDGPAAAPGASRRQAIHDLRNLFGVVASAGHCLGDATARVGRKELLKAIEDAASRGARLATELLGDDAPHEAAATIDLGVRLADLVPMLAAVAQPHIEFDLQIAIPNAGVRIDPDAFDATMIELISNARSAGARRIVVRARKIGPHLWILVGDSGCGMTPAALRQARGGGNGRVESTGLAGIRHFAASCHGKMRIRSRPLAGTTVALILPTVLSLAVDKRSTPVRKPPLKETIDDEDRQPVAA